jgi:hypothetical protein
MHPRDAVAVVAVAVAVLKVENVFAIPEYPWSRGMEPIHAKTQELIGAIRFEQEQEYG